MHTLLSQKRPLFGKFDQCFFNMQQRSPRLVLSQISINTAICKQLRKDNLSLEQKSLEEPLTLENIMESKAEISESMKYFHKFLYTDNTNRQCSARKSHMTEGSSADALFAYYGGKLIPGKHLS